MSGAEQFTAAVPERSGPTDWRGGLERSGARRGRGRVGGWWWWVSQTRPIPRPPFAREKKAGIGRIAIANNSTRR